MSDTIFWTKYRLGLTFTTPLCGGVPKDPEALADFIEARSPTEKGYERLKKANPTLPTLEELTEELTGQVDPSETDKTRQCLGFRQDEQGLFLPGANLRAHLKDCAGVLAQQMRDSAVRLPVEAVQQFRAKFIDRLYVAENRLGIRKADGTQYKEPTGHRDFPANVLTRKGPRTCLKRVDYCDPARLDATLLFLPGFGVTEAHLRLCLEYGMIHGMNQDRSLGFGRYVWNLETP